MIDIHYFRKDLFIVIIFLFSYVNFVNTQQVGCEDVESRRIEDIGDELLRSCRMDEITVIDSADFTFSSDVDGEMSEIFATLNSKIEYLPIKIYEKFPNLLSLSFSDCGLKALTFDNLQGLTSMKRMKFSNNQIETIEIDTFKDLTRLLLVSHFKQDKNVEW
jgi:hypothetical protein